MRNGALPAAETTTCGRLALVRLLERYGVDTVFGIPGTHTLELYRGLACSRIRHVPPRHEQGAGFMADGYARASGRPGVCFLIAGPGLLNAATAIAQAYSDSVPMLVVSSVASRTPSGIPEAHIHELPSQGTTMASITGFSATAQSPDDVPAIVERAFASFRNGRPRPVHIALPLDLLPATVSTDARAPQREAAPALDRVTLGRLAEALRQASRPLIIVGGGGIDHGPAVTALGERLGAGIMTTVAGKGAIRDDHPLHYGSALTTKEGQQLVADADLVLALGTELAASDTWTAPLRMQRLLRIDIDPTPIGAHGSGDIFVQADLGPALATLLELLPECAPYVRAPDAEAFRRARRAPSGALQRRHLQLLEALREALPDDAFIAADMAQIAYTANLVFRCTRPRSYFYPVGLSTLGYALPAAIGAKLAAPERAGIALVGDCGFLFTVAELATAVELELPIVVVLWNNGGLGQIRDHMIARSIPPVGVDPRNPDFLALARAFGCRTARPASVQGFKREIRAALRRRVPTVIEIRDAAMP